MRSIEEIYNDAEYLCRVESDILVTGKEIAVRAMRMYAVELLDEVIPQMHPGIANWASKLEAIKEEL